MAFTVQDFPDLLRLLAEHPEWQAELRRHVLTEELLELPAIVRRLADAQARTDEHLASVSERLDRLTARVDDLAVRLDALTARVDTLTARVDALTARVDDLTVRMDALIEQVRTLTARVDVISSRVDTNTGELLEFRYSRRAGAYFSPLLKRVRVVDHSALADLLDDAVEQGHILEAERRDALLADLVIAGQRRADREPVYLVVEISAGIGADDVRRAADRASVLAKLGRPAIPVVAGQRIGPEPAGLASAYGVWQVLDGHLVAPPGAT